MMRTATGGAANANRPRWPGGNGRSEGDEPSKDVSPRRSQRPGRPGWSRRPGRPRHEVLFGAIAGVLTAAVALGVGQLISGLTVRQGSPAVVVGQAAIDLAPPPVKNFAISVFGANDKTALLIGILVVLAIVAAVIGVAAMRRLAYGYAGLVLFAAIGLAAALSRPDATFGYAVPTIFGAAAGAFALNRLTRAALATIGRTALPGVPGSAGAPGSRGAPARDADRYEPGTAEAGTQPTAEAEAGIPSETEAAPTARAGTGPGTEAEAALPSEAGTGLGTEAG